MAEAKKNKGLDLQETKGSFQIRGVVTGTDKDNFFKSMKTKTGKDMRLINFGVNIDKGKTVYIGLNGMEQDYVYFSKSEGKGKDKKTVVEKVAWKDRNTFKKDGFRQIGINLGIEKIIDATGTQVNDKKIMGDYDACKYISDKLKDDSSVFIRGRVEFSTYNDKRQTRFIPNQISLCKPVDFEEENYETVSDFEQVILFMGIEKNDDKFTVSAKIVTYNTVEDAEFVVENPKLAKNLKGLKPYTAIKVFGNIRVETDTDQVEVEEDDGWGTPNPMERIGSPTTRTLVITGADKDSIDTTTYSEAEVEAAIAKIKSEKKADKDYGDDDNDWGSSPIKGSEDDDSNDEW